MNLNKIYWDINWKESKSSRNVGQVSRSKIFYEHFSLTYLLCLFILCWQVFYFKTGKREEKYDFLLCGVKKTHWISIWQVTSLASIFILHSSWGKLKAEIIKWKEMEMENQSILEKETFLLLFLENIVRISNYVIKIITNTLLSGNHNY